MKSAVVEVNDTESGKVETHSVRNLHLLRCSALQRLHQLVTCNCVDGANDKLCFAKLHTMAEASKHYTLGTFDLAQNLKYDPHDTRANGTL